MKKEAELFKILGDPTRLRLAVLLAVHGETCVCHLAFALDEPDYKVSRHLAVMRSAGLVEARREGTWMYYRLSDPKNRFEKNLEDFLKASLSGHPVVKSDCERISRAICELKSSLTKKENQKIKVLFLCTGNSCRSQMAEGWARHLKGNLIDPYSAGIQTHGLDASAVKVMQDAGVDISGHRSKTLDDLAGLEFDCVVTVCDRTRETCPVFPGKVKKIHRGFDDPPTLAKDAKTEEEALAHYRRVRDEIRDFIESLPGALTEESR